jgi:ABC-type Fe3+-siderophore transport system permease subunit
MNPEQKRDLFVAPLGEGALILIASLAAWLTKQPLIFTSLGPTAYELIETPHRKSARPYNVIVGHLIGVVAGFLSLLITHAWRTPAVSTRNIQFARVEAAVLAAALTVFGTLLARATQPAALSTTLLISLGTMQQWRDALIIMSAVLLMLIAGEPLRRWRHKQIPDEQTAQKSG